MPDTATQVKERGIMFSAPMVRAILAGTKTQTRRIVNGLEENPDRIESITSIPGMDEPGVFTVVSTSQPRYTVRCPYGKPGDRLWVKETWQALYFSRDYETGYCDDWGEADLAVVRDYLAGPHCVSRPAMNVVYAADGHWDDEADRGFRWRSPRVMPRWASRITLEIVDVRVERVQDISEADARAEGVVDGGCLSCGNSESCGCSTPKPSAVESFANLWQRINGKGSWTANPWVWVISFKRLEASNA